MTAHDRFLELAATAIDFELTAPERDALAEHLSDCQRCRAQVDALRADARRIAAPAGARLSPATSSAILARVVRSPAQPTALRMVALAAMLALLAIGTAAVGAAIVQQWERSRLTVVPPSTPPLTQTPAPTGSCTVAWTDTADGSAQGADLTAIVHGPAGYVAIGSLAVPDGNGGSTNVGFAWRSIDGATWNRDPIPGARGAKRLESVAVRGGRYVIVGHSEVGSANPAAEGSVAWTSDDAVTWSEPGRFGGSADVVTAVAAGPDGFVATGSRFLDAERVGAGLVWTSPDGVSWSTATELPGATTAMPKTIAWSGDQWLVGGEGGTGIGRAMIWWSVDARTWTLASELPEASGSSVSAIAAGADRAVAVLQGSPAGLGWSSTDGRRWSAIAAPAKGERWFGVTAAGAGFVAVGRTGDEGEQPMVTAWSADGLHWQTDIDAGGRVLLSIVAVDGALVGVGNASEGPAILNSRACSP
ncbi:MAG TPA: zf-HC2 domain-containing protein [Candidatus Limnocylindrales bacterium]|jgi:hypothetical protein|nr:zf-HC2 domain-containing protein [Candidatus Limnocylindrales bacterium]